MGCVVVYCVVVLLWCVVMYYVVVLLWCVVVYCVVVLLWCVVVLWCCGVVVVCCDVVVVCWGVQEKQTLCVQGKKTDMYGVRIQCMYGVVYVYSVCMYYLC